MYAVLNSLWNGGGGGIDPLSNVTFHDPFVIVFAGSVRRGCAPFFAPWKLRISLISPPSR